MFMCSYRWLPEHQYPRWFISQTLRGSESDQLPLRAGLWQLCWSGKGKSNILIAAIVVVLYTVHFITLIHMSSPQENAHFSICESLIAAIELMKCNMRRPPEEAEEDGDSDSEIQQLKQKIRLRRQQIRRSRLQPPTAASHHGERCFHSFHLFRNNLQQ